MNGNPASRVDTARLWDRHARLARHGATSAGGVNRQALSAQEISARKELIEWASALGLTASSDAAGNLFLRLEGSDPHAEPILTGSHLDSQPSGGWFDGTYGVLAGLEAVQAIIEAKARPRRSIEVVAWMNEEGSRFAPGMMGSAVFAGAKPLEEFLPILDSDGISVAQGLDAMRHAFPQLAMHALRRPVAAYVEVHIEQGPILEREGYSVGVVTGMQGKRTFRINVLGEEAHAGTATRRERKDALLAAMRMINAMADAFDDAEDVTKFTVGKLDVSPNAPSVVPGSVEFSIDLRHVHSDVLTAMGDQVPAICAANAGPCEVKAVELTTAMSLSFPNSMTDLIRQSARRQGIPTRDIYSAAGHDARFLHEVCPTAMIFVPCKDGVSHSPLESARPEDLAAGTRVLVDALLELSQI